MRPTASALFGFLDSPRSGCQTHLHLRHGSVQKAVGYWSGTKSNTDKELSSRKCPPH